MELEVLVEIQESKRAIKLSSDLVNRVEEIRDALKLIDPVIHVELGVGAEGIPQPNTAPFILQRYCPEWDNYLDIINAEEIQHRDRLRVIPRPSIPGTSTIVSRSQTAFSSFIFGRPNIKEEKAVWLCETTSTNADRLTAVDGPSSSGTNVGYIILNYLYIISMSMKIVTCSMYQH